MAGKADKGKSGNRGQTIIRREEVVAGGHHGGAWKVAYADFVTAMMAFFLLMWLLNATTEDQRKGLADYFSPNNLMSHASSGTGDPFGGHTAFDSGALVSDRGAVQAVAGKRPVVTSPDDGDVELNADPHGLRPTDTNGKETGQEAGSAAGLAAAMTGQSDSSANQSASQAKSQATPQGTSVGMSQGSAAGGQPTELAGSQLDGTRRPTAAELRAERERQEKEAFEQAAQQMREAVKNDPALTELAKQLAIDMTPEGLRIQIMDEEKQPMFATGSAAPNDRARLLLQKVVPVLLRLPQAISIAGHTDAAPFPGPGRTNWELSAERANATRRLLVDGGLPERRIRTVTGHADRDLLLPADPLAAANRRIAIVVLREADNPPVTAHP
jgi:chemotaxis protein MotB